MLNCYVAMNSQTIGRALIPKKEMARHRERERLILLSI